MRPWQCWWRWVCVQWITCCWRHSTRTLWSAMTSWPRHHVTSRHVTSRHVTSQRCHSRCWHCQQLLPTFVVVSLTSSCSTVAMNDLYMLVRLSVCLSTPFFCAGQWPLHCSSVSWAGRAIASCRLTLCQWRRRGVHRVQVHPQDE